MSSGHGAAVVVVVAAAVVVVVVAAVVVAAVVVALLLPCLHFGPPHISLHTRPHTTGKRAIR